MKNKEMKIAFKLTVLLAFTIIAVLLLSSCSTVMELEYEPMLDGSYRVSLGSTENPSKVIIPEIYNGKPVTKISIQPGDPIEAETVIIPPTVKEVTSQTLSRFTKAFEIEDGVTYVSGWAIDCQPGIYNIRLREGTIGIAGEFLRNNPQATTLECPTSLRYLASYALSSSALKSIILGEGVEYIGSSAFFHCTRLETLVIPDSVPTLPSFAFVSCTSLKRLVIPTSITELSPEMFRNCPEELTFFYRGTEEEFGKINLVYSPEYKPLSTYNRCYYSQKEPTENKDKYWFYFDGYPLLCSEY